MAKEEQKAAEKAAKEEQKAAEAPVDERTARFVALLAAYEKQNPAKFASKKAAGEFDKIPDDFQ